MLGGTVALAVLTAAMYVHGHTFHSGYLLAFGIEPGLVHYDFEETLLQGWRAYTSMGLVFLPLLILGMALMTILAFLAGVVAGASSRAIRMFPRLHSMLERAGAAVGNLLFQPAGTAPQQSVTESAAGLFLFIALVAIVLVALILLSSVPFDRAGRSQARAVIAESDRADTTSTTGLRRAQFVLLHADSAPGAPPVAVGRIIDSDKELVILYAGGRVTIFPRARINRVRPL